jgi:hypothetical protein
LILAMGLLRLFGYPVIFFSYSHNIE